MFTEDKITEIFCIADDFCNFFDAQMKKYTFKSDSEKLFTKLRNIQYGIEPDVHNWTRVVID